MWNYVLIHPISYVRHHPILDVIVAVMALWVIAVQILRLAASFSNDGENKIMRKPFISSQRSELWLLLAMMLLIYGGVLWSLFVWHTGNLLQPDGIPIVLFLICFPAACIQDLLFLNRTAKTKI